MPVRVYNDKAFWQTLRQEWETTDVGFIALARKHGISSVTTVKRRQAKEGWSKDQEVIAARRSLANAVLDHTASRATPTRWPIDRDDDRSNQGYPAIAPPPMRASRRRRSVAMCPVMMIRRMCPTRWPWIRVNPDRETLANLLSTAVKGVESGIVMKRRALAPDETGKLAGVPTAGESGGGSRLAREFLRQMDDETTEKMRTWALEVQRQQRQTDTGGSPPDPPSRRRSVAMCPGRCPVNVSDALTLVTRNLTRPKPRPGPRWGRRNGPQSRLVHFWQLLSAPAPMVLPCVDAAAPIRTIAGQADIWPRDAEAMPSAAGQTVPRQPRSWGRPANPPPP
jgi:hypothetical protein